MNASANSALFLQSSASSTLLRELTNCGSAETDDYTYMPQQEDEWCSVGESLRLRTAQSDEGQKVSTMKLGYHHRRLLRHLLDHPDSAHGLYTQQFTRKAEWLIKMGTSTNPGALPKAALSVITLAQRFAHTNQPRADRALQALLGLKRFPSDDTILNYFRRFTQAEIGSARAATASQAIVLATRYR